MERGDLAGLKRNGEMQKFVGTSEIWVLQGETRGCKREGRCKGQQRKETSGRLWVRRDPRGLQGRREMQRVKREWGEPGAAGRGEASRRGEIWGLHQPHTPCSLPLLPIPSAGRAGMQCP